VVDVDEEAHHRRHRDAAVLQLGVAEPAQRRIGAHRRKAPRVKDLVGGFGADTLPVRERERDGRKHEPVSIVRGSDADASHGGKRWRMGRAAAGALARRQGRLDGEALQICRSVSHSLADGSGLVWDAHVLTWSRRTSSAAACGWPSAWRGASWARSHCRRGGRAAYFAVAMREVNLDRRSFRFRGSFHDHELSSTSREYMYMYQRWIHPSHSYK
jgi:hypothetical protein